MSSNFSSSISPLKLPGAPQQEQEVLRGYLIKKSYAAIFQPGNYLFYLREDIDVFTQFTCSAGLSGLCAPVLTVLTMVIVAGVITRLARGESGRGGGGLPGQGGGQGHQRGGEAGAEQAGQPGQPEDHQDEGGAGDHEGGGEDHFARVFRVFTISTRVRSMAGRN